MLGKIVRMRSGFKFAILGLLFGATSIAVRAQTQPPPVAPARQEPGASAPATPPASAAASSPAAATAAKYQAATKRRARHVITDDEIRGIGSIYKGGSGPDLSGINDCDRNCFEAVRRSARIYPSGVQWKKDLLNAIERVRNDAPWQSLLSDFGTVRGKFCMLEQQRNDELVAHSDPKNVTAGEISVEEKYDRLFKDAQAELLALYDRASLLRQEHVMSGLEIGFMDYQTNRIVTTNCYAITQAAAHPNWESNVDP